MTSGQLWLKAAGTMSLAASLLHLACILGGPDWYRALGAGEGVAKAAERGEALPAVLTLLIAIILASWAAFAFSAAGIGPQLPLRRTALVLITLVLALRGLAILVPHMWRPDLSYSFKLWSSLAVLVMALTFAIGTTRSWASLSE